MKKSVLPEQNAGVWIDQETACIIHFSGMDVVKTEKLKSGVESRVRQAGEDKAYTRFGRAFIDNQEKTQHRQRNQRAAFFKAVIRHLQGVHLVYIFGPGQARHGLHRMMEKDPLLTGHTASCVPAGRLDQETAVAAAVAYFSSDTFRQFKKERRKLLKASR